jgi:uncharacterized protein YqhQ
MNPLLILVLAQVAGAEMSQLFGDGFLSKIMNMFGLAMQVLTTVEPERKHLEAGAVALNALLELEDALEKPELPRKRCINP